MKNIRMDRVAQNRLALMLEPLIEVLPNQGGTRVCRYKDGWSDEKVAVELRKQFPHLGRTHVSNYRYTIYGSLINRRPPTTGNALVAQVVIDLCRKLGEHALADRLDGVVVEPAPRDLFDVDAFDKLLDSLGKGATTHE